MKKLGILNSLVILQGIFLFGSLLEVGLAQPVAGEITPTPISVMRNSPVTLPAAVASLRSRGMRDGRTALHDFSSPFRSVVGRANSGILAVDEPDGSGCLTSYGLVTHFATIWHAAVFDLSAISLSFGNESILVAGILPDGRPGVSAIVRNRSDTIRAATHHLLPIASQVGEIFLRVGFKDGAIYVAEASSASIIGFIDSNGDLIPDARSPVSFQFPGGSLPSIYCIRGPQPNTTIQPLPFLLFGEERYASRILQALYAENGVLKFGTVRKSDPVPDLSNWELIADPAQGHQRVAFSSLEDVLCEIEVKRVGESNYSAWVAAYQYGSTTYPGVSPRGDRPLEAGDTIRIISNGQVRIEKGVDPDRLVIIWAWGVLSQAFTGNPIVLHGENLSEITEASFEWTPLPSSTEGVSRKEIRDITTNATAQTLTITGGVPFSADGILQLRMKHGNASDNNEGYILKQIIPQCAAFCLRIFD